MAENSTRPVPVDAVAAACDVLGRAGATAAELGYDDDHDPVTWWMSVRWQGTRLFVDQQFDAQAAAEGVLLQVIDGGQCVRCGATVRLLGLSDTDVAGGPECWWYRTAARWMRGCDQSAEPLSGLNRFARRRLKKVQALHQGRTRG